MTEIPKLLELERTEQTAILRWKDGTEHNVSWNDIRFFCPCAKCSPNRDDEESALALRASVDSFEPYLYCSCSAPHSNTINQPSSLESV